MKAYIVAHIQGGFTEDEVIEAFGISHARFRKDHPNPPERLTWSCMLEIHEGKERNPEKVAKRYKTTVAQARRGFALQPNLKSDVSLVKEIKELAQLGMTQELIADQLNIPKCRVIKVLRKKRDPNFGDQIRTLLATGLYTQQELAEEFRISQSAISYYAEEGVKRTNRPKLKDAQWQELKKLYKLGSTISELSRKFNVSRAAIYRRLK